MSRPLVLKIVDPRHCPGWNGFVDAHPHGWIAHRSEWFDMIVQVAPGTRPHYVVVQREGADEIEAALPLCLVRSALGRRHLESLPYTTLCDPLVREEEAGRFLTASLPEVMRRAGAGSLQVRTFQAADIFSPTFSHRVEHEHHEIDLTKTEAEIMASFDGGGVRNRIRKALKGPLQIREAQTTAELKVFYEFCVGSRQRLGLPAQPWSMFEGFWRHLRGIGGVELLLVEYENRTVGGLLVLLNGRRASAEILTYERETRTLCTNHLLFWTAISRAKAAGRRHFDFGRTPVAEVDLVAFKLRWGTVARPLPIYSYPPQADQPARKQGRLYEAVRSAIRHAPRPVYRAFSDLYFRWSC